MHFRHNALNVSFLTFYYDSQFKGDKALLSDISCFVEIKHATAYMWWKNSVYCTSIIERVLGGAAHKKKPNDNLTL